MNVGLDLRLVDTKTLEVVDVISYQKQIVGREIRAGVFDMLGGYIFDVGAGQSALEPIQLGVRSVIERAVLEMVSKLYATSPQNCQRSDPLSAGGEMRNYATGSLRPAQGYAPAPQGYAPAPQAYAPAPQPYAPQPAPAQGYAPAPANYRPTNSTPNVKRANQEFNNDQARQDPYRWYSADDATNSPKLRGGVR